jgi:hypothetical protein
MPVTPVLLGMVQLTVMSRPETVAETFFGSEGVTGLITVVVVSVAASAKASSAIEAV